MEELDSRPFYSAEWRIDPPRNRLSVTEREFKIEPLAMAVLVYLASHRDRVVSKRELLDQVWEGRAVSDDVLTVSIYGLRKILGDSAQDPRFIATVPRHGYRWIAPVTDAAQISDSSQILRRAGEPASQRRFPVNLLDISKSWIRFEGARRRTLIGGGILLAVVVIGALLLPRMRPGPGASVSEAGQPETSEAGDLAAAEEAVSIAVLPFTDLSPSTDSSFFAEGLSTELVNLLVRSGKVRVSGRASSAAAQKNGWTIPEIGEHLGVRYVLEGSIQRDQDEFRITVQLSEAPSGFYVRSESYARKLGDILELQTEIAGTIAKALDIDLGWDSNLAGSQPITASIEAYEAYLRGRYHWHQRGKQDLLQAAAYFERAIEIDPLYAAAYSGLADTYLLLPRFIRGSRREYLEKANEAADHALELDDHLAEAHASRAEVRLRLDQDIAAAEEGLRRAIDLNPHYATAHYWLSNLLFSRHGRVHEALRHSQQAERLDPLNLLYKRAYGHLLLETGSPQEAQARFLEAEKVDAASSETIWGLARCSFAMGRYRDAAAGIERLVRLEKDRQRGYLNPFQYETLTVASHLAGDHDRELRNALSAQQAIPGDPWPLQMEARARVALGQPDLVRELVGRILEEPRLTATKARWWLRLVAELHLHGDPETAQWVASKLAGWYRDRAATTKCEDPREARFHALALWVAGDKGGADQIFQEKVQDPDDCAGSRHEVFCLGEVGSLAALVGSQTTARRSSALLDRIESRGDSLFWQATIAASSGDHSGAVDLLRQSLDHGFTDHWAVHSGVFFLDLYDYSPFCELTQGELGWPPMAAACA